MLKFQWNALRRGDPVLVHGTTDSGYALQHGKVVIVESKPDTNVITVRVGGGDRVICPARLTVHLDPLDADEDCWRCDTAGAAA